MLDSVLKSGYTKDIDWIYVQRALDRILSRVIFWWILFTAFATPLWLTTYSLQLTAYNFSHVLFFAFCVCVGWILHLARELFARDRIAWQKSWLGWGLLALFIVVIATSLQLTALRLFGFTAFWANETGPLAWLSLIGFCALVIQARSVKFTHLARAAIAGFVALFLITAVFSVVEGTYHDTFLRGIVGTRSGAVPNTLSLSRFITYGANEYALFGAGLGQSARVFWETAESVDLDAMLSILPAVGGVYSSLLWDGGILLLAVFLFFTWGFVIRVLWQARKQLPKTSLKLGNRTRILRLIKMCALLVLWLIFLWFKSISFLVLYTTFIFILLICLQSRQIFSTKHDPRSVRVIFSGGLVALRIARFGLLALIVLFAFAVRALANPDLSDQFYVWRAQEAVRLFQEEEYFIDNPEQVSRIIAIVAQDMSEISMVKIQPAQAWSLARSLSQLSSVAPNADQFLLRAQEAYDYALSRINRNVILLTEASRFYRLIEHNSSKAFDFVSKALEIDDSYLFAVMEKTEQLKEQGNLDQALATIEPYASKRADMAYAAARMALDLSNFDKAVEYYLSAIGQNPKHLQARFELAQAYIALGQMSEAEAELDELESFIAEDDAQTKEIISELRFLIKD